MQCVGLRGRGVDIRNNVSNDGPIDVIKQQNGNDSVATIEATGDDNVATTEAIGDDNVAQFNNSISAKVTRRRLGPSTRTVSA